MLNITIRKFRSDILEYIEIVHVYIFCLHENKKGTQSLDIYLKLRALQSYFWSVSICGTETWVLPSRTLNRLEAFEFWCHRRSLKIPRTKKKTNAEVLQTTRRKPEYLGHVIRGP